MPTESVELPGGVPSPQVCHFPDSIRTRLLRHLEAIVPKRYDRRGEPMSEAGTCIWGAEAPTTESTAVIEEWTIQARAAFLEVCVCNLMELFLECSLPRSPLFIPL